MAKSYLESLLGEREKIQLIARQHWFILIGSIIIEIIAILVILAGTIAIAVWLKNAAFLVGVIGFALLIITVISITRDVLIYSHHEYVITNRRVIQITGILNKQVTDSSLEKVNDVKMVQSALGRLFNYGDVEILTASELGVNKFKRIEKPVQFKTAMLNAKAHLEDGGEWVSPRDLPGFGSPESIPALISQLESLHRSGVLTDAEFQQKKTELLAKI
jgi:uncharacterized membrane protein YdbT with pleckstrin-like domain